MTNKISIIISILLTFGVVQCSGDFFDQYEKGRYVEENPPAPDTTAPDLVKAEALESNTISIEFSEQLDADTADNTANYHIQGLNRLEIIGAALEPDGKTVTLQISVASRDRRMKHGMEYTLLVQNVADSSSNAIKYAITNFFGRGWVIAEISGTPPEITNSTSASINVGGTDIIAYQYSIDGGAWSAETPTAAPISLSGLSEGYHTLKVVAQKSDGEWQDINYATTFGWNIDTTPPLQDEVVLVNTPDNITEETSIGIAVTGEDITAYQYKIEYREDQNYSWTLISYYNDIYPANEPISLTGFTPAQYQISIIGRDSAGNWQDELNATTYQWIIIGENDIVAILYNLPAKFTTVNTADITVGGLRIMYYQYSLDGAAYTALTGINNILHLDGLTEAAHTLEVIGADEFSITQDGPTSYSWSIDYTAPTAVLSNTPAVLSSDQAIHVIVSGSQVVKYRYKIDTGLWSGLINSGIAIDITGLTEGAHTLSVSGVDSVGNEQKDQFAATAHAWTIDITAPAAELGGTPVPLGNNDDIDITVSGTSVTAYKFKLDNEAWGGEVNISDHIMETVTEGSHQLYVIGRDQAGNWQNITIPTTCEWVVDTIAPIAVLSNTPNDPTGEQTVSINVYGGDSVFYKCRLNGGSWTAETAVTTPITNALINSGNPLADKQLHTVDVITRDSIGNWQSDTSPTTFSWNIDTDIPIVHLSALPPLLTNSDTANITVDQFNGLLEFSQYKFSIDGSDWSEAINIVDLPDPDPVIDLTGLSDSVHVLYVIGKKEDTGIWQTIGNKTEYAWTVDTTPPAAALYNLPNDPTSNNAILVTVQGLGVTEYKYRLITPGIPNPPWSIAYSASEIIDDSGLSEEGDYTLEVIAKDAAENWQLIGSCTSYTWERSNDLVLAELSNVPGSPTSSKSASITVGPSNLESYIFRYGTAGNPPGAWQPERLVTDKIILESLADGVVTLEVRGKNINNDWQDEGNPTTVQWTIDTSGPTAELSNLPSNPTNEVAITVYVGTETGSPTVVSYKYKLDAGTWQGPDDGIPTATPISSGVPGEGYHRLYVVGKSQSGIWQLLSGATSYTWLIDHLGPAPTLSNTPSNPTTDVDAEIYVGGSGLVAYKYAVDEPSPDWGTKTEKLKAVPITLSGLSIASHELRVIGRDSLNNWSASPALFPWEVIYIESPDAQDTGDYDTDPLLRFTWDNPANTGGVKIEIATDAAFTNIVFPESSDLGIVEYYDYIADVNNGSRYYARVKVKDMASHWADWGGATDGISLVGSISGQVKDTNGTAINGAAIALKYMSDNNPVLDPDNDPITAATNSSGNFTVENVPIGMNYYRITVTIDPRHAAKNNITVVLGEDTGLGIIYIVPAGAVSGTLSGTIADANIGSIIDNAEIKVYDWENLQAGGSYTTNSNGVFTTASLTPGTYSIIISKVYPSKNYFSLTVDNIIINGNKNIGRQSICEVLSEPQVRLIYQWDSYPSDPDIFIVGPTATTQPDAPTNRFCVRSDHKSFFEGTGAYVGSIVDPGDWYGISSTTSLVQDGVTGYGPEAINLYRCAGVQYARGIYTFTVHRFAYNPRGLTGNTAVFTLNATLTNGSKTITGTLPADRDLTGVSAATTSGSSNITTSSGSAHNDALYYRYGYEVTGANIPAGSYIMWYDRGDSNNPFQINNNATATGSDTIAFTNRIEAYAIYGGTPVSGTGINPGTTIASVTNTGGLTYSMELSENATADGTQTLTFYPGWGNSSGLVRVYDSGGMVREIIFPSNYLSSDNNCWKALKIDVQGSTRAKRKVMQINQLMQAAQTKTTMDW